MSTHTIIKVKYNMESIIIFSLPDIVFFQFQNKKLP